MYNEFIYDGIIESLAFEDQRHYVFILCMKNIGILDKEYPKEGMLTGIVGKRLGLFGESLTAAKNRLMDVGIINENWQPKGWDTRQFAFDHSDKTNADRQKRYRESKKTTTPLRNGDSNALRNVTVTAVDADADTEESTPLVLSLTADDVQGGDSATASMPTCPHPEIIKLYAESLPELPQPRIWEGTNRENLKKRWRWVISDLKAKGKPHAVADGLDFFKRMFSYINESDFLCGRGAAWAGADLGWIAKGTNFAKILQGNYENKGAAS